MLRLAAVIALLPAVAAAQPLSSSDKWFVDMLTQPYTGEHDFHYAGHVSASALASTRESGSLVAAGGELAWVLGKCRILHGGGEGVLLNETASAAVWGGFCIPSPLNRTTLTVRSNYQLQPSYASLPVALRSRYTGTSVDVTNTFIGWSGAVNDHEIFPLTFSMGVFEQPMLDSIQVSMALGAYRRVTRETNRTIEAVIFNTRAAGPGIPAEGGGVYLSATANELAPLKLTKQPIGEMFDHRLELDIVVGVAWGSLDAPPPPGSMYSRKLLQKYDLFTEWAIRASKDNDTWSISTRRAFEPTYTDELLLDTRGELGWTRVFGKNTVAVAAFGAHTLRYDRTGLVDEMPSGGGRAAYVRTFPYKLRFTLAGELARSFFARLDDAAATDAEWSGQVMATMSVSSQ